MSANAPPSLRQGRLPPAAAVALGRRRRAFAPRRRERVALVQARFVKHRRGLLTFLHHAEAPPPNTVSERSLRPSVVHRKVTGGFRNEAWTTADAALRTVTDTARKRGAAIFATLLQAAGTPLPAAGGLAA